MRYSDSVELCVTSDCCIRGSHVLLLHSLLYVDIICLLSETITNHLSKNYQITKHLNFVKTMNNNTSRKFT